MFKYTLAKWMVSRKRKTEYSPDFIEQKHVISDLENCNDSSFFYGSDHKGNAFICRMAFRGNRPGEWWFDFYLKDKGFIGLKADPGPQGDGFKMGNLEWNCLQTAKSWEIKYSGPLADNNGKNFNAAVKLVFTGEVPMFELSGNSDPRMVAEAISKEKWNRDFFNKLKVIDQVHIEQMGKLEGTIVLDGETIPLKFQALRDHSFGARNWADWTRHFWISGQTDSGYCWTVTSLRLNFLKQLTAGFIITPDKKVSPIYSCDGDTELLNIHPVPDTSSLRMKTADGKEYHLEYQRHGVFPYLMDGVYHMREAIGTYTFNGEKGLGMIEFGFDKRVYGD